MSKIVVSGLVNMETSVSVDAFPIEYRPVDYRFFGITSTPAGVGLNVSLALSALGDSVNLCSFVGPDPAGNLVKTYLQDKGVNVDNILCENKSTAQSVVLFDKDGRRTVLCDLTDNQELSYDKKIFCRCLDGASIACLCNINYSAELIPVAVEMGIPIATDVHCLSDIHDEYNSRFMRCADIIFLSNENILGREKQFVSDLAKEYDPRIVVVGMGSEGAMLYERGKEIVQFPAVFTRPVVNTVGAGDSLYSAFIHFYAKGSDAAIALRKAIYFASYKIGESGASKGFLSEDALNDIIKEQGGF